MVLTTRAVIPLNGNNRLRFVVEIQCAAIYAALTELQIVIKVDFMPQMVRIPIIQYSYLWITLYEDKFRGASPKEDGRRMYYDYGLSRTSTNLGHELLPAFVISWFYQLTESLFSLPAVGFHPRQLYARPSVSLSLSLTYTHPAGSTSSHPRSLSLGFCLWPGTWLTMEWGSSFSCWSHAMSQFMLRTQ
jgi:hypothetical protein